jgi:hypothetical protein
LICSFTKPIKISNILICVDSISITFVFYPWNPSTKFHENHTL